MSSTPYNTNLPPHLRALKEEIEGYARGYGLDFYETIFEVIDAEDLNEVAAYGGFPTRYPHWSFGMAFEELKKGYDYGLSKIYEMVINNDPCYAYLMRCNHTVDQKLTRFKSKDYMDDYINPKDALKAEEEERKKKIEASERTFPEHPEKDTLLFLIEHAPLKPWQRDVLSIIRDEAYYFAPQGQTKVMNEGWASFWHSTIMTERALQPWECVDYADHHSGTMAMQRGRLNPYKLGIELFRDIEMR